MSTHIVVTPKQFVELQELGLVSEMLTDDQYIERLKRTLPASFVEKHERTGLVVAVIVDWKARP